MNRPRSTGLAAAVTLLLTLFLALVVAPATLAATPAHLPDQITDETGSIDKAAVQQAADELLKIANIQLWVDVIPTSGDTSAPTLAQQTFQANGLGGNDLLLLVALNDHRYGWWQNGATTGRASDQTVSNLLSSTTEPRFRAGDYTGGIVDFANALGRSAASGSSAGNSSNNSTGDTGLAVAILAIGLLIVGGVLVFAWWRQRGMIAAQTRARDARIADLTRESSKQLIAADDAIRNAAQELSIIEPEAGSEAAAYEKALDGARAEIKKAFATRQQLDDEVPEDPPTKERMLNDIMASCQKVSATLAAQAKWIQLIRDQEQKAPELLKSLPDQVAALTARRPAAEAAMTALQGFAPASSEPVRGNLEEADKRLASATAAIDAGNAALAASPPDLRTASQAARAAQDALLQATALLDALEQQAKAVTDARSAIDREIAEGDADVKTARKALETSAPGSKDPSLPAKLQEAVVLLDQARAQAASPTPDPIAALKVAQRGHATVDGVLASFRAASEQIAREKAALQGLLGSAATSIQLAESYILTRRHGVGGEARTRLSEAQRHLDKAKQLAPTDVHGATVEAQQADRLAEEAYALARDDFDDWDIRGGGRRGGDNTGALVGGLILGGILGGMLGGGGHRGGWGGGPWGGGGFGGGWGGGGGGGFGGFGGGGSGGGGGWGGGGGGGGGGSGGGGGW